MTLYNSYQVCWQSSSGEFVAVVNHAYAMNAAITIATALWNNKDAFYVSVNECIEYEDGAVGFKSVFQLGKQR